MAVPFSNTKLRVPRGFQNILEGLAREVLRSQPNDIYAFGAVYFEQLLKLREEGGEIDPAEKGAQLEDRFYNNRAFEKPDIDPSNPEQQQAALKIQTKYRQHHAKEVVKQKRREQAAIKIQAGYRGWHDRKRVKELKSHVDAKSEVDAQKAHEEDTRGDTLNYDNPEVVNAATTIQAGFKGYKARKQVQELRAQRAKEAQRYAEDEPPADSEQQVAPYATSVDKQVTGSADEDEQATEEVAEEDKPVEEEVSEDKQVAAEVSEDKQVAEEVSEDKQVADEVSEDKQVADEIAGDEQVADEVGEEDKQQTEELTGEDTHRTDDDVVEYSNEQQLAATKIQAGVRGYLARKQVKAMRDGQATSLPEPGQEDAKPESAGDEPAAQENAEPKAQEDAEPATEAEHQKQEVEPNEDAGGNVSEVNSARPGVEEGEEDGCVDDDTRQPDDEMNNDEADVRDEPSERTNLDAPSYDDDVDSDGKHVVTDVTDDVGDQEEGDDGDRGVVTGAQDGEEVEDDGKDSKTINYDDPEVEKAATKIQAGLRGMQARKKVKELKHMQQDGKDDGKDEQDVDKNASEAGADDEPAQGGETEHSAEFGFDPSDPVANKAASKIQAGFKGYKTRKEMGDKLKHNDNAPSGGDDEAAAGDDKPAE